MAYFLRWCLNPQILQQVINLKRRFNYLNNLKPGNNTKMDILEEVPTVSGEFLHRLTI